MAFEMPFPWLWGLAACLLLVLIYRKQPEGMAAGRIRTSLVMRALMILCILFAYANPIHTSSLPGRQCILFLIDKSDSISEAGQQRALNFMRSVHQVMGENDQAGMLTFADQAELIIPPTTYYEIRRPPTPAKTDATDITDALEAGFRTFPEGSIRTLILMSDGNETTRSARALIESARRQNVRIHTLPLERNAGLAWGIEKLFAPSRVNIGERFRVRALLTNQSNQSVRADITLRKDGVPIKTETGLVLAPGATAVTLDYKLDETGVHAFDLQVDYETGGTSHAQPVFVDAAGMPKVLLVSPESGGRFFEEVIESRAFVIDAEDRLPGRADQFLDYDCIILNDVPRADLSDSDLQALHNYVQDFGGGLITVGGGSESGLEAFAGTQLEDMLPVELAQRHAVNKKRRDFVLMLLIDRSGSMNGEKIEMAKAAAINAIEELEPGDSIGVIAFDDQAHTLVDLTVLEEDKSSIMDSIRRLTTGGGTDARYALVEAFRIFSARKINIRKHLILMTDGITTRRQLLDITRRVADKDVTISTIAIGRDANVPILEQIRQIGDGAFHLVTDFSELPRIVVGDMGEQVKDADDIEEQFIPEIFHASPILTGIGQADIPSLKGYVASTLKVAAVKPLMTNFKNSEDPILAHWYYGLGRSTVMMTGVNSAWSDEWLRWKNFGKLWEQTIRWTMRARSVDAPYFTLYHDGNRLRIQVDWAQASQVVSRIRGTLRLSDNRVVSTAFKKINNSVFEGAFAVSDTGMAQLALFEEGREDKQMWFGKVYLPSVPETQAVSAELDGSPANYRLLQNLSSATEGQFDPTPRDVIETPRAIVRTISYRDPLLILAILLLLVDVGIRRLNLSRKVIAQRFRLIKSRLVMYFKNRFVH